LWSKPIYCVRPPAAIHYTRDCSLLVLV
jgi:hypothetical protein